MAWTRCGSGAFIFATIALSLGAQAAQTQSNEKEGFSQVPEMRLAAADATEEAGTVRKEEKTTETETVVKEDDLTLRQTFDTYSSLEDGQPGTPGQIELNFSNGWQTQSRVSDPFLMLPEIQWTPAFLPNTQLGLSVPLTLGNGGVDGNGDIYLSWLQRWVQEQSCDWWPTFSTINELRIPNGYGSEGVDWTMTGILAKEVGPGTAYLNAFVRSANGENNFLMQRTGFADALRGQRAGDDRRHFQWGFRFGYKWRITDCLAIVSDYILQSSQLNGRHNQHIGEVSAEWRVTDKLTIGPGIMCTLDGNSDHANFGMGLKMHYAFN